MAMNRKTKWIKKVLHFYCAAGDHYLEESEFHKNRRTKFRISSICKGCFKGLCATKYKASQTKKCEAYHLRRQSAMKRVKLFEAWREKLRRCVMVGDFSVVIKDCDEFRKCYDEGLAI